MRSRRSIRCGLALTVLLGGLCFAGPLPIGAPPTLPRPGIDPGALPPPLVPTPATAPTTVPAAASQPAPIPPDVLQSMFQRELGAKYKPADAARLAEAHQLLEQYFAANRLADRKLIVSQINALNLDPNLVGRLARIRANWQATEPGIYYVNERVGPHTVHYFYGLPKGYDRARPWPLVIKLPTPDAFLKNPPPDGDEVAAIYAGWIDEELARHPDAVAMMPLLHMGELYGPSYAGMNNVYQPMLHLASQANLDPARIYMLGHSMAAHATWNLALHFPTYFAAINPLAGGASAGWQRLRIINLRNTLPVVWHDANDQVIKVSASSEIVRALRSQKIDVEYEQTKGIGHAPDAATAERQYVKMRGRVRDLYPPQVSIQSNRPDTMFNRVDWVQIWQPINTGKEREALLKRGLGKISLYENTYKLEVTRKGNRFDIKTENVDSFRLYLNDQMVDFSTPVTVVVNKQGRFEAMVRPDVEEMLKDQLFLGRGWRYYTAVLDIDVVPRLPMTTRPATRPIAGTTKPATRPTGRIILGPSDD